MTTFLLLRSGLKAMGSGCLSLLVFGMASCLSVGPRGPDILHARPRDGDLGAAEQAQVRAAMQTKVAAVSRFTADMRLGAVGPDGRVRAVGQVLLERPDKARLTILLPFGPPAWLGVSNGQRLASWDVPRAKIRRAAATRDGLAELSAVGDVGLAPEELVALMFGEVKIPPTARLSRLPAEQGSETQNFLWQWQMGSDSRALVVTPEGMLRRFDIATPSGDKISLTFKEPQALMIPGGFRLRFEPQGAVGRGPAESQTTVIEGHLTDVREIPPPTANAYILEDNQIR